MKHKVLLALLVMLLMPFKGSSQNDSDKSVIWGLKAALNVEIPGNWRSNGTSFKMYSPGIGFTIGGLSNIYLGKGFYFEPGVMLFYERYRYDLVIESESGILEKDPALDKFGFRVPLVVGYEFNFSERFGMNIFTGPQFGYAFAGKIHVKQENDFLDFFGPQVQRRFDCSWKVGVGFPANSFVVSLEADFGVNDLLKGDMSFRENRVGLGVTYYF